MELECEECEYPIEVEHEIGDRLFVCPACGAAWNVTARRTSFITYEVKRTFVPMQLEA
jgi:predicted RNA-binding Zn-ribbon protein involved in translation (DUF1610 family)